MIPTIKFGANAGVLSYTVGTCAVAGLLLGHFWWGALTGVLVLLGVLLAPLALYLLWALALVLYLAVAAPLVFLWCLGIKARRTLFA